MSMAESTESSLFDEEAASTGVVPGNGSAEESALEPQDESQVASSSESEGDYNARLRAGGEFAEREIKTWERKFTKADAERNQIKQQLTQVESLLPIVDQLGGAQNVIEHLETLGKMIGDPNLGPMIRQFQQTGTVQMDSTDPDAYVDPVEAELRKEIQDLKGEIQGLRGDTFKQSSTLAKQHIQKNFETVLKELPLSEEQLAKVNAEAQKTIHQWSSTPEGVRALENLDERSVRTLIRGALDDNDWIDVVRRMDASRHEGKKGRATDALSSTATARAQTVAKTAQEACREAFRQFGVDPNGRLMP